MASLRNSQSADVKATLQKSDVHRQWESLYRTPENERFYETATDKIVKYLDAAPGSLILDAGCGSGRHSVRFAKRGFNCYAVDFSPEVLTQAEILIREQDLERKISLHCEDILNLSFESNSFSYVICWGVLMHIPDLNRAVTELCRVLKPGGTIIIEEDNMHSIQGILPYIARKSFYRKSNIMRTPAGIEYWLETPSGTLLARKANIHYLIDILSRNNVITKKRWPGQFTELYTKFRNPLMYWAIHNWNDVWFRFIKLPYLAFGNILIGQKETLP